MKFIDISPLLPTLQELNPVYEEASIPAATYGLDGGRPSIAVPNLLMVRDDMPDNLACALTTLMIEQKEALVAVHPAAEEIDPGLAAETDPVSSAPGLRTRAGGAEQVTSSP